MGRRVFLSFVEEDLDLVRLFRGQAMNPNGILEFSDHSVKVPINSESAEYVKRQIREKISNVAVVICLIGQTTYSSAWVDWELLTAYNLDRGIMGVKLQESYMSNIPSKLLEFRSPIIPWRNVDIVQTIEEEARRCGF